MLSFEHDQDLTQFLFTPEPQNITLMPEEEQAKKRKLSQLGCGKSVQEIETPKDHERRNNHRDAERKQRQEMAILYTSLRSKLPKEYVQSKSFSNDMHGAVNYINHLKQKIGGLVKKRDDLKKLVDAAGTYDRENTSVKVECGKSGIEVILKTSSVNGFPLSKFLSALNGEGMAVVNCTSTLANEALIHVINCDQVDDACDQTKLEKRLRDLVYNNL